MICRPEPHDDEARASYGPLSLYISISLFLTKECPTAMEYDPNDLPGTDWSKVPDSLIPTRRVESQRDRRRRTHFIPPVPLGWFDRACVLPGKALAVGLILWRLATMRHTDTVTLTQAALKQHGLG